MGLQDTYQVPGDAGAAGADRMAEGDAAAFRIEALLVDGGEGLVATELVAAEVGVAQGLEAGQHLAGEGLVDLPPVDIPRIPAPPVQETGDGIGRT